MDAQQADLFLRTIGRLGFFILLLGIYRIWRLPVLRKHSRQFFWVVIIITIASLTLSSLDFYQIWPVVTYGLSIKFNVLSTLFLAVFLNWRASQIRNQVGKSRLHEYTHHIDEIINELKRERL